MRSRIVAVVLALLCLGASGPAAGAGRSPGREAMTTYDELPVGAPTSMPWWQHRRLHLGDTVITTRRSNIASRNGTTVVARDPYRLLGGPTIWSLVVGTQVVRLPMHHHADKPLISADGRWLAWLEVRARETDDFRRTERYRVVIYDVVHHRVVNSFRDRRRVAWEDGFNGIWLRTLSNEGRLVLLRGSDGVQVLSPRGHPVAFAGPSGSGLVVDGWPLGTSVFRHRVNTTVVGSVGRDGGFHRAGRLEVSFSGLWSADGSTYTYMDYDSDVDRPGYWVTALDGEPVRLDTPVDVPGFALVGWESPDAVILWHENEYSDPPVSMLVRCSATSGACERVPGGPRAGARATIPSRY